MKTILDQSMCPRSPAKYETNPRGADGKAYGSDIGFPTQLGYANGYGNLSSSGWGGGSAGPHGSGGEITTSYYVGSGNGVRNGPFDTFSLNNAQEHGCGAAPGHGNTDGTGQDRPG